FNKALTDNVNEIEKKMTNIFTDLNNNKPNVKIANDLTQLIVH
ncbi:9295_t:CDS:1, partial [Racocetra fulgida]